jgi:hypothetical protein
MSALRTVTVFIPTITKIDGEYVFFCEDCETQILEYMGHLALHGIQ